MAIIMGVISFVSVPSQNANVYAAEPVAEAKDIKLGEPISVETSDGKTVKIQIVNDSKDQDSGSPKRKKLTFGLVFKNSLACLGWSVVGIASGVICSNALWKASLFVERHTGLCFIPISFKTSTICGFCFGAAPFIVKIGENIYEIITAQ